MVPHPKCRCFTFSPFAWVYWDAELWQHSTPIQKAKRIKLRQQRRPRPRHSEPAEHSATCQTVCHFEKIPPADFPFSLNENDNAARIKPRLVKWNTWPRGLVVKLKTRASSTTPIHFCIVQCIWAGCTNLQHTCIHVSPVIKAHLSFFIKDNDINWKNSTGIRHPRASIRHHMHLFLFLCNSITQV